jgi:hypothetical protein
MEKIGVIKQLFLKLLDLINNRIKEINQMNLSYIWNSLKIYLKYIRTNHF